MVGLYYYSGAIRRKELSTIHITELHPFLDNFRGGERDKKLMKQEKYDWESFEE